MKRLTVKLINHYNILGLNVKREFPLNERSIPQVSVMLAIPHARQANFACAFKVSDEVRIEPGCRSHAFNDLIVESRCVATSSKEKARRRPVVGEISQCDGTRVSH